MEMGSYSVVGKNVTRVISDEWRRRSSGDIVGWGLLVAEWSGHVETLPVLYNKVDA